MIDMELSRLATQLRRQLGEDDSSPIDIFSLVQTIPTLTLIFYPLGQNISGACFKKASSSIIAINTNMTLGRQRFSLAHELYHLYDEQEQATSICSSEIGKGNATEKRADQFASYFLMPPLSLYDQIQKCRTASDKHLSLDDIIDLESFFGVSHQAMLSRLQHERYLTTSEASAMQSGVIAAAAKRGVDVSLYRPSPENKKIQVLGHYIRQAERLLDADVISIGKYEEWLLAAFRDDIVFGLGTEGSDVLD